MATKTDLRQTIYRGVLDQLSTSTNPEGDNLASSINDELTPLLRLSANNPASLVVNIGGGDLLNSESDRRRAIPHIGTAYVQFTSGTITFPAASGGNITTSTGGITILNLAPGNFAAVLVYLDGAGDLNTIVGDEAVTESAAITNLPPPPDETLAAGFIVVQNIAGTIQNITQDNIRQFGTGTGGGGAGTANEILETIKNHFLDSFYELVSPLIFKTDKNLKTDPSSTGSFNLVTNTFDVDSGETFVSINLLDPQEFLGNANALKEIELLTFWNSLAIDTAATYEVSRNGGLEWQVVDMERVGSTDLYRGYHVFDQEASDQALESNAVGSSNLELNATTRQRLSQPFTLSAKSVVRSVDLDLTKLGTPDGFLVASIVSDDGLGNPSTASQDILSDSVPVAMSSITTGTVNVALPEITLAPGNYHVVLRTVGYTGTYSAGVTALRWDADNAASAPFMRSFDGSVWATETNFKAKFVLNGIELDLRIRVTGSAAARKLAAFGIYYDKTLSAKVADGQINVQIFEFSGDDDETEFNLTKFTPHPDLLKVYDVGTGQVYAYGAFSLDGNKVIFESGQFLNPGETITLRFVQVDGTVFDQSDINALLLASNGLGSTDPSIDRSAPGVGIKLRSPNGQLWHVTVTDAGAILTTPL